MAIGTTTVVNANSFIPEIWSTNISDATQAATVLAPLMDRRFEDEMESGAIIHIADLSNPGVRFKAADTPATYSNITESDQDVTINRHAYCAFLTENIVKIQSRTDLRDRYTSKTGYSLMAMVEGDITSGLQSLPDNFSQFTGTLGTDPSEDDLINAVTFLDNGDVPEDDRFIWCSPGFYAGLLKLDVFRRQEYVGQARAEKAIIKAQVGELFNAPVYKSSLANANPAAANQAYSWFCHKEGVALIMQQKPTVHSQFDLMYVGVGTLVDVLN